MSTRTSDPETRLVRTRLGDISIAEEGPPDGVALLTIHGVPGSARDFRYLGPLLSQRFRVVRLEMPGFGGSPRSDIETVSGWARVPEAVADALGVDRFLLMSHSFGGGAAIEAASVSRRRVQGLVLLASNGARRHRGMVVSPRVLGALSHLFDVPPLRPAVYSWAASVYRRLRFPIPETWEDFRHQMRLVATQRFERTGRLAGEVRCPTIVVFAADDPLIEVEVARDLAGRIPMARVLELRSGGHYVQKHGAAEIARAVLDEPW